MMRIRVFSEKVHHQGMVRAGESNNVSVLGEGQHSHRSIPRDSEKVLTYLFSLVGPK